MVGVALVYFVMSALVKWQGIRVIEKLFPPVVIGPVIILIGLSLAGTGVNMAKENWVLALLSLVTAVIVSMKAKGLLKLIPIFCGIIVGYLAAWLFYDLDLSGVRDAAWIGLPQFVFPKFSWEPVLFMIPVAIAPVIEHIGDVYVVNTVAGKDFVKDPGLHRTLLGDGLACFFAGLVGGPPVTTYSEVTGAMSLTKITNPQVIRIAAFSAILFSVIGKISALLQSQFHIFKLDPATYYVNRVPIEFNIWIYLLLNVCTLLVSVLMLIGPSYLITRIHPARSIRFE